MNILEKIDKFTEEEYTTEKIDYTKPAGRKKLVKNLVNKNASFLKNLSNELFDKIDRKAESEVSKEGISDPEVYDAVYDELQKEMGNFVYKYLFK